MGLFEKLMKRMAEYYARECGGSTGSGKLWTPNTLRLLWEGRKWARILPTEARKERR
jgi:hypothetical protein